MGEKHIRNSNLELYRIIVMLLIVAHHYVVNSGVLEVMSSNRWDSNSIFLYLFGAWGKTGINCFVLITGYFMCKSKISTVKYLKILSEVVFYKTIIYFVFAITGYEAVSVNGVLKAIIPVRYIDTNFTGCFLVFYLMIPFLSILCGNMDEKMHRRLLAVLGFTYVFLGTLPKMYVTMNYVSWFSVLFLIAAYIRLYPKKIYEKTIVWGCSSLGFLVLGVLSIVACILLKREPYSFVSDSNTFIATGLGISSFLFFKNLKVKTNKIINSVASSTFGVLLIHANSETMRSWLWQDFINVRDLYQSSTVGLVIRSVLCVFGVFFVCIIIDQIRIYTVEKLFLNSMQIIIHEKER